MTKFTFTDQIHDEGYQDAFQGTGSIYAVDTAGYIDFIQGDYLVEAERASWPQQYRAYRLHRAKKGKPVPKLPRNTLGGKVLIVFGPNVSARQAASALELALASISEDGLLIGLDAEGNCPVESLDGSVRGG